MAAVLVGVKVKMLLVELDDGRRVELTSFPELCGAGHRYENVAKFGSDTRRLAELVMHSRAQIEDGLG